jgi:hypothetical protein
MSSHKPLRLLLILAGMMVADSASAAQFGTFDQCRIYGYVPHTLDYALCRMNVRRYRTTGPCGDSGFAATHREYCHLNPPPFI